MEQENLVDRIYEAALFPDEWGAVLHEVAALVGASWGSLQTRDADAWTGGRFSPLAEPYLDLYFASAASTKSRTPTKLLAMNRAGFVADHEIMDDEEFLADSLMSTFGSAVGLHRGAASAILVPGGDAAVLQVWRRTGQPRFCEESLAALDALRPHLARAAMLATRLRLQQLRAQTQVLAALGIPAAVLAPTGKVIAANELIQAMGDHFTWLAGDQLGLADKSAGGVLRSELARSSAAAAVAGRSFVAQGSNHAEPIVVHVLPLKGNSRELFNGAWSLLVVNRSGAAAPDDSLLKGLFDLTSAEARIAKGLLEGLSVAELSNRYGSSTLTVRTQVRSVLAKSGVTRQSEFIVKLRGVTATPR